MFAALASQDERITQKLEKFIALAPVAFLKDKASLALKFLLNKKITS
jgi:hypothetical protein